jgi:hypothetical protein
MHVMRDRPVVVSCLPLAVRQRFDDAGLALAILDEWSPMSGRCTSSMRCSTGSTGWTSRPMLVSCKRLMRWQKVALVWVVRSWIRSPVQDS